MSHKREPIEWVSAVIIEDDSEEECHKKEPIKEEPIKDMPIKDMPIKDMPIKKHILNRSFIEDPTIIEIGIDEAGRGPMFGRVYAGVVVLPKDDIFNHSLMKDSKKFHSKKKIEQVAEYIKENAIAWAVAYEDENVIDNINILQFYFCF